MIVGFAVSALVQGGIMVALAHAVLTFVPAKNATTRYAVWFVTLLALVAAPVFGVARPWLHFFAAPSASHAATFSLAALRALNTETARWSSVASSLGVVPNPAIAGIWIGGACAALARLAVSLARIGRIRREATAFSRIDGIPVLTSPELTIPIAAGMLRPAIVLPAALVPTLSAADLRCTLEHELAHVRRGDIATNALQRVAEALLFWNPWIHFVGRRLAAEREAACDDVAVDRIGRGADYAQALASLGAQLSGGAAPLLTPSAFGSRNGLLTRIERLTSGVPGSSRLNYAILGGSVALFSILSVAVASFAVASAPASASAPHAAPILVAASCKNPNANVRALAPAAPLELPKSQLPLHTVTVLVRVTVAPNGKATAASIYRSSGDANVDRAVLTAAEQSTYSPKLVNCAPVESTYLLKATFGP